ncbi:MAG: hypothetical protein ABMA02_17670 [Saprospiraceae bacterium]
MKDFWSRYGKYSPILILAAAAVFFANKCCKGKTDEKPPSSIIITEAVKAPVAIAFIDANRLLGTTVPKARVTLIDADSMVVSSDGIRFTTIEVSGGVMSLGLRKKAQYSPDNPYRFTIKVEIEGYSTNLRNILVQSDEGQYVPIFMSKLEDPPAGAATVSGAINLSNGIVSAYVPLSPTKANGISPKNILVEVEKGTQPIYCDRDAPGKKPPAKLNYRIAYASPRNLAVGRTFPGGPLITDAIGLDGKRVATPQTPMYFTSQGWITIEMDADGEKISSFSKPLTVTMPVLDSLVNPLAIPSRFYQKDDTIPIWSLSDQGVWRSEGNAKVEGSPGKLVAKMTVSHLSTWNLDCPANACARNVTPSEDLTVSYVYNPPAAGTLSLYSEIVREDNGTAYGITGLGTNTNHILDYASGGGSFTISRTPNGERLRFIAYDNTGAPGTPPTTGVLARTDVFSIDCANQPTPVITIPPATARQSVNLRFEYLPGPTPLTGNAVWFKHCEGSDNNTDCNPTIATGPLYCETRLTSPLPQPQLMYGSILSATGTVTFYKVSPDDFSSIHCIRLWYLNRSIDFPIDFSVVTPTVATPEEITGKNDLDADVIIYRWIEVVGTDTTHVIQIQ